MNPLNSFFFAKHCCNFENRWPEFAADQYNPQWELKFSGRDTGERRYGQTIRIPAFIRKVQ